VDNPKYQSVWRQEGCTGAYVRRAEVSSTENMWTDEHVKDGTTYCYYVTVTDRDKNTSGSSNIVTVTIPTE
jgi:fibronectin type 3 domain-containing protein